MFQIITAGSEIPDDTCYIIGKTGVFLKKKLDMIESLVPVQGINFLEDVVPYVKLHIDPIPVKEFGKILGFFKYAYNTYKSEAQAILHYCIKTRKWIVEVPLQEATAGSVRYKSELSYPEYLRIGTIHSHASMSAFHSGTDVHDEEDWDGLHITLGNMNHHWFSVKASIVSNKIRCVVDPTEYIKGINKVEVEGLQSSQVYDSMCKLDFPESWKSNIKQLDPVQYHNQFQLFGNTGRIIDRQFNEFFRTNRHTPMVGSNVLSTELSVGNEYRIPCETCVHGHAKFMKELMEEEDLTEDDLRDINDDNGLLFGL